MYNTFKRVFIISDDSEYFCGKVELALIMKLQQPSASIYTLDDILKNESLILDLSSEGVNLIVLDPALKEDEATFKAWQGLEAKLADSSFCYIEPDLEIGPEHKLRELISKILIYTSDGESFMMNLKEKFVQERFPRIYQSVMTMRDLIDWTRYNFGSLRTGFSH